MPSFKRSSASGPSGTPVPVRLYSRPGCCLCDGAEALLQDLVNGTRVEIRKIDITGDAELERKYGLSIPVVFIGERLASKGPLNVARVRRLLGEAAASR